MSTYTKILIGQLHREFGGEEQKSVLPDWADPEGWSAGADQVYADHLEGLNNNAAVTQGPSEIDGVEVRSQREALRALFAERDIFLNLDAMIANSDVLFGETDPDALGTLIAEKAQNGVDNIGAMTAALAEYSAIYSKAQDEMQHHIEVTMLQEAEGQEAWWGGQIDSRVEFNEGLEGSMSDDLDDMSDLNEEREAGILALIDRFISNPDPAELDSVEELVTSIANITDDQMNEILGLTLDYTNQFVATKTRLEAGIGSFVQKNFFLTSSDLEVVQQNGIDRYRCSLVDMRSEAFGDDAQLYGLDPSKYALSIEFYRNGLKQEIAYMADHNDIVPFLEDEDSVFDAFLNTSTLKMWVGCPKLTSEAPLGTEDSFEVVVNFRKVDDTSDVWNDLFQSWNNGSFFANYRWSSELSEGGVMNLQTLTHPNWEFVEYDVHSGQVSIMSTGQDNFGQKTVVARVDCGEEAAAIALADQLTGLVASSQMVANFQAGMPQPQMFLSTVLFYNQYRRDDDGGMLMLNPDTDGNGTFLATGIYGISVVEHGDGHAVEFQAWTGFGAPDYQEGDSAGILDLVAVRLANHSNDLPAN